MNRAGAPWWDTVDWWLDPRLAYAKGLADGRAIERGRADTDADHTHRCAVRHVARIVEKADRRTRADLGEHA